MHSPTVLGRAFAGACAVAIVATCIAACSSSSDEGSASTDAPPPNVDEVNPTFTGTIEPILQQRCQSCHRPDGIAPTSLVTYDDVTSLGALAKQKVAAREMPPWGAFDDDTCKMQHAFKDDLRMTDTEIAKFVQWVDTGMPIGDPNRRVSPKTFAPSGLPNKTHTLTMPKPYEVVAGGKDDIRCFSIDPGFAQDTWLDGSNVMPGDPRVVHHVIVYVDPTGESVAKAGAAGSYPCFGGPLVSNTSLLLAWAPGSPPMILGEETGLKVPKGARLVMQVHYHPSPTTTVNDATAFELRTIEGKPRYAAQVVLAGNAERADGDLRLLPGPNDPPTGPAFLIPANVAGHTESMELRLPETISEGVPFPQLHLYSVGSHMHWAGVDMKIEVERKAEAPGQPAKECLLGTPKYDFNWQRSYGYDAAYDDLPIIGPGDVVRFTCTYDNTLKNRHIAQALADSHVAAPTDIRLGETTLDEMCLGAIVVVRPAGFTD